MAYNRFGAAFASVVALYPQTQASDFGGQAAIEEAIDRAVDKIANALTPDHYKAMTEPALQLVVGRATAGQVSATLGLTPVVDGSVHLWSGQPIAFQERPILTTDVDGSSEAQVEMAAAEFSVNATTGVVTLTSGLALNDRLYASYQVNVSAATFAMPSLARLACRGAAGELGKRLYSQQQQEWGLVETFADGFAADLDALTAGTMVPDEIRALRWWQEVERSSNQGGSVRLFRG